MAGKRKKKHNKVSRIGNSQKAIASASGRADPKLLGQMVYDMEYEAKTKVPSRPCWQCRYYEHNDFRYVCASPNDKENSHRWWHIYSAEDMRKDKNLCGPEGRLFKGNLCVTIGEGAVRAGLLSRAQLDAIEKRSSGDCDGDLALASMAAIVLMGIAAMVFR